MKPPRSNERPGTYDHRRPVEEANDRRRSVSNLLVERYPAAVRDRMVDLLEAGGSTSYADVSALELAELQLLTSLRDDAMATRSHYVSALAAQVAKRGKGGKGMSAAQREALIDSLEGAVARHTRSVVELTKQVSSKLRHLRLITQQSGGGPGLEDTEVAVPAELASQIDACEVDYDYDLMAPVREPGHDS